MKYRVVLSPEGGKWNAEVPKLPGCVTWGRSLGETRRNVREAIAALAAADGADAARVEREAELVEELALPARAMKKLDAARDARAAAEAADAHAATATLAAIASLLDAGLSTRDIGELLALSHQRVQQLKEVPRPVRGRKFVVREAAPMLVASRKR